MLATQFNLQSKTKAELHGMYVDLFNQLAEKNISRMKKQQIQAMLYVVKSIILPEP